ncbi:protein DETOXIFICATION 21-like isoform X2 [Salvia divinorum]|uniref:Protein DETOXIFICATION 21-like isoform X2 n=1 Tax=Salvia divinorum TaxID=28513 RepID=A0ABD1I4C9_SALDI
MAIMLLLLSGNLVNAEVSVDALSICLNMSGWAQMISTGFMATASVRVANELGRGNAGAAKLAILMILVTSFSIALVVFVVFMVLRVILGFLLNLQVQGVWIGMIIGSTVQTIILVVMTCMTDWDEQISLAHKRIKRPLIS